MRFPFETTIVRGDEEIEVKGVYSVTPVVPARLYGDYPQPAEGGEIELVSVQRNDGKPLDLTEDENDALCDEMAERSADDIAAEQAAADDWRAQQRRDDLLMERWSHEPDDDE